ncbi:hypothetical protein [Novosphingobium soli]|uniref:Uncharacterized protein n=1 Tax=Novosphingobium soli TaxID=574956 RepID=A0ABV6CTI4_9SPHN
MSGGGELEPQDSRKVTGTAGDPSKSWREQEDARAGRGEYEPVDSRSVTGQAVGGEDRGRNDEKEPPRAGAPAEGSNKAVDGTQRADWGK